MDLKASELYWALADAIRESCLPRHTQWLLYVGTCVGARVCGSTSDRPRECCIDINAADMVLRLIECSTRSMTTARLQPPVDMRIALDMLPTCICFVQEVAYERKRANHHVTVHQR